MIQLSVVVGLGLVVGMGAAAWGQEVGKDSVMWWAGAKEGEADYYLAFRGS
ncbi:MAG: hypothetical protein NTU53_14835 [Planctomycetota bacterium]|nr:hypothetical protein [Planctomycetota bacterium]